MTEDDSNRPAPVPASDPGPPAGPDPARPAAPDPNQPAAADPSPPAAADPSRPIAPDPSPPATPRRRRRLVRLAGTASLLLLAIGLAALWLAGTDSGTRALLSIAARASGGALQAEGVGGSLAGPLHVDRLRVRTATARIEIESADIDWSWRALLDRAFEARSIRIGRLLVATAPSESQPPAGPPQSLALPIAVRIDALSVGRAELALGSLPPSTSTPAPPPSTSSPAPSAPRSTPPSTPPSSATPSPVPDAGEPIVLSDMAARIDSDGGGRHRLDGLRVSSPWGSATGRAEIGAQPPFQVRAAARVQATLDAGASAAPRSLALDLRADGPLERLAVSAAASGVVAGDATIALQPFEPVPIGSARLALTGLDPSDWGAGLPRAALSVDARLEPRGPGAAAGALGGAPGAGAADAAGRAAAPATPDWRTWTVTGPIEIVNAAPGAIDAQRLPLVRASTVARWQSDRLTLSQLRLFLPGGGSAEGELRWVPPTPTPMPTPSTTGAGAAGGNSALPAAPAPPASPPAASAPSASSPADFGRIDGELRLAGIDAKALHGAAQSTRLAGRVELEAEAAAQSVRASLSEPRARADLAATHRGGRVEVERLRLTAREASLEAKGRLDLAGRREFALDGTLSRFDPSAFGAFPRARVDATVSASGALPTERAPLRVQARARIGEGSTLEGRPLGGSARAELAGARVSDADVDLSLAGNRLQARGAFGNPGDVLRLQVEAPALERLGFGLAGALRADATVRGELRAPSGELHVDAARLALPGGERIGRLVVDASLARGVDGPVSLDASLQGWRRGDPSATLLERAEAKLRGTLREHVLQAQARAPLQGRPWEVALRAAGGLREIVGTPAAADGTALVGAVAEGRAQWRGRIEQLRVDGGEHIELARPAPLEASRDAVRLSEARLATSRGAIAIDELAWSPQALASRGAIDDVALPPELLAAVPQLRSTLRLAARWDLRVGEVLEGTLSVARTGGDLTVLTGGGAGAGVAAGTGAAAGAGAAGTQAAAAVALGLDTLRLDLNAGNGRVNVSARVLGRRVGDLSARGTVPVERDGAIWKPMLDAPLEASADLSVPDLAWIGPAAAAGLQTGGAITARLRAAGTVRSPAVTGTVDGDRLRVALVEQGVDLAEGRVRLTIDESLLTLREARFVAPLRQRPPDRRIDVRDAPGTVTAQGSIRIAGEGAGQGLLRFRAERVAVLQSRDRWLMASGDAALRLEADRMLLEGRLAADAASLHIADDSRPQLGSDVIVVRRGPDGKPVRSGPGGAEPKQGRALPIALDLEAALGERFYVSAQGLEARMVGAIRLSGEVGGTLLATGSVRTVDGTFSAYNQKLTIERGVVNFQGPIENPGLNVRAMRRGLAVEAGVEVTGTVQDPRIRLVSNPEVPDAEKLSWLVLGYAPNQLSGREQELLGSAALALLSGRGGGAGGPGVLKDLGVDFGLRSRASGAPGAAEFERLAGLNPNRNATTATSDRIVSVGRRLSSRLYLGVEQSLTSTLTIVQLTYQLSRRLNAVARTGAENSLDLIYTFTLR